jgi:hypothetical protein
MVCASVPEDVGAAVNGCWLFFVFTRQLQEVPKAIQITLHAEVSTTHILDQCQPRNRASFGCRCRA